MYVVCVQLLTDALSHIVDNFVYKNRISNWGCPVTPWNTALDENDLLTADLKKDAILGKTSVYLIFSKKDQLE
jgi:hypothetical protein